MLFNSIEFIVYKIPPMNLLAYPEILFEADNAIKAYFENNSSVIFKNENIVLEGDSKDKYILSKYDGYPNEKSHNKMAEEVFDIINVSNGPLK